MKLLFISHDASRTGAPYVLLHLLRWIRLHQPRATVHVALLKGGDLESEFKACCHRIIQLSKPKHRTLKEKMLTKLLGKDLAEKAYQKRVSDLAQESYNLIYANTIVALPVAALIKSQSNTHTKVLLHVHELPTTIQMLVKNAKELCADVDACIAVSQLVARNVETYLQMPADKISVVYETSENKALSPTEKKTKTHFEVGGSGLVHWRKGDDVFIQVARYIRKHHPGKDIRFTWVGKISEQQRLINEADIEKMGLASVVRFVGQQNNPAEYFNAFDVFLMPSREDPFPLVCIEVGMLGKPIICFEGATGTAEVIAQGGGHIVPYLDIEAMAEKIIDYYLSPERLATDSKANQKQFANFAPEIICPELYSVIKAYC